MHPTRWLPLLALLTACDGGVGVPGVNVFSIEDDKELGAELDAQIESEPEEYPLLDRAAFPDAYTNLERIRDTIMAGGAVELEQEFDWEVHIIDDDETLNAFAAPGGYIYIYTGLMRFLETEDEFAGVLAHEIAHADQRHSTQQLTQIYGITTLLGVVLGQDPGAAAMLAAGLVALQFSREHETDADEHSVVYLCETSYASDGAAGFFEKLEGANVPEFLSTHPSDDKRVENIHSLADDMGCDTTPDPNADWSAVLATLP